MSGGVHDQRERQGHPAGQAQGEHGTSGAPTIIPTAKTVIDKPARARLVDKSLARSGSNPATTNTVGPPNDLTVTLAARPSSAPSASISMPVNLSSRHV
jgi:hypothetical protein